jgi:hypothetical protein
MMNNFRQDDDSLTLNSEADYSVMMRTNQARDSELNNRLRELENLRTNRREEQSYPIDSYMSRSIATSSVPYAPSPSTDASVSLMRDWMKEKDLEITNLKSLVKEQQEALTQKEIDLAVLRERLANQEQRMQHELKMMKIALTTATNKKPNKNPENGTNKTNSGKEIHIQSLHVKVGSDMMQNQYDGKAIQAATQQATAAALEKIIADHENQNNTKSSFTQDTSFDIKANPSNQTFEKSLMLRNGQDNETKEPLGKFPETTKNFEQSSAVQNPDSIKFNFEEQRNDHIYKLGSAPSESILPSPAKGPALIEELLSQNKAVNKFDRNPPQASVSSDSDSTDSDGGDTFDESFPWEKSQYSRKDPREDDDTMSFDETSIGQTIASSTYGDDREHVRDQKLLDPYGDSGKYTGVILRSTGMPHGVGRMIYDDDGRTYEGDWKHGRWHGHGKATFANRDSYEGEYRADQRHGRGKYEWADGRVYDGEFKEDKRQGNGTFSWPDGAKYIGEFNQGQREGHGQYYFLDGGYYNGSWRDGRYDGFGGKTIRLYNTPTTLILPLRLSSIECHWEDGRTYKGEWRLGMAHGQGVEMYPDGNVRHDGQWIEDDPIR